MRTRMFVVGGIALALVIAGVILPSGILVLCGVLGLAIMLQFTQLDRYKDPEQRELYIPTYKKEWEDKHTPT
ncbi:MAG: hypothetical protein ACYCZF_09410 [Anaerolineae bacterium]